MKTLFSKTTQSIKYWWMYTVFGVSLIALGVYTLITPEQSFKSFGILFSIAVLLNGVFDTWFSLKNKAILKNWEWYLINGILKFSIGLSLLLKPEVTTYLLPYLIGLYFMASSGSVIATSLDLKSFHIEKWQVLFILGLLLFALSAFIIIEPHFAENYVSLLIGTGFFLYGYIYILISKKLKEVKQFNKKTIEDLKKRFQIEYTSLRDRVIRNIKEPSKNIKTS